MTETKNLPKLSELVEDTDMALKNDKLNVLLNQPPPEKWLEKHHLDDNVKVLPIARIDWLLLRIFGVY